MKIDYLKLILAIGICQGAGIIGSIFTAPSVKSAWYINLNKPSFQPPNWLFGPVWVLLFLLMGISFYLIWSSKDLPGGLSVPLGIFAVQLVLNILWSFFFFYLKNPFWAFIEIVVLWVAILVTLLVFYRLQKAAGLLLAPYLLWVAFAAVLNFSIWTLNR
jgi:tryptophan-rich sensory protein